MVGDMVATAAKAVISEVWDQKKATADYMLSAGGRFCCNITSDDDHVSELFKMPVNDINERSFVTMTGQIQYYGEI